MLRWWDGTRWTDDLHPTEGQQPGGGGATGGWSQSGAWSAPGPQQPPTGAWPQAGPGGAPGYPVQPPGYQSYPSRRGFRRGGMLAGARGANTFSLTAIGFSIAYVALAIATGFVFLGIVPVISSVRAFQRGEKLAPLAAVAAGASVVAAILVITHRH